MKSPAAKTAPQSKMRPVAVSNGMVHIPTREYEYNIAKIDLLERELTAMREMMMRMSYEHSNRSAENVSVMRDRATIARSNQSPITLGSDTRSRVLAIHGIRRRAETRQSHIGTSSLRRDTVVETIHGCPRPVVDVARFVAQGTEASQTDEKTHSFQHRHSFQGDESLHRIRRANSGATSSVDGHGRDALQMNSIKVAPMRYQCAFDGVTLSTSAMLRNHFERFHADDAREFVKKKLKA